ncbi:MAG: apolipoprotein N-acyltransferase [Lentisphaeria bacterium]|nr:apolipoprotein N-acyltransferase [Lentisphaeria bacterium]
MDIFQKKRQNRQDRLLAFQSGRVRIALEVLLCAFSGALYSLVFAGTDWNFFAWFGLIPLYWVIRNGSSLRAFLLALVWGYFESLFAFMWLREIMFFIPFVFGLVLGFFPALWGWMVPFLRRNFLIPPEIRLKGSEALIHWRSESPFKELFCCTALASWWCLTEWLRSWIFTGLPWNLLGSSQWRILPLIQICEYTGVYGLSFLVVLVNLTLASGLEQVKRKGVRHYYPLLFSLALVCACLTFGLKKIRHYAKAIPGNQVKIGAVQPHLSQRRNGGREKTLEAVRVCVELTEQLLERDKPNLIVWPETAVPVPLNSVDPLAEYYREEVARLGRKGNLPLLLGTILLKNDPAEPGGVAVYNSAVLVQPAMRVTDVYSKVHIVPFGEYVPFGREFPILNRLVGMGRNLKPGPEIKPMEILPGLYAGISVCYEDIFPYISRIHARKGANVLLVVTNDAWYPTSNEPVQHFANSLFRAVETRLPLIRIGNSNYSVLVEPTGQLRQTLFHTPEGKPDPGVQKRGCSIVELSYSCSPVQTFYTRYGNVFVGLCGACFAIVLMLALQNWRTFHQAFEDAFKPISTGQHPGGTDR